MKFDIISIFPEFFEGPISCGMLRVAQDKHIVDIKVTNPRDFVKDRVVDDYQFGGGAGMVFKPEPITKAIDSVRTDTSTLVYLTPKGDLLDQKMVNEFTRVDHMVIIAGRYKGVDERIIDMYKPKQVSVGNYILSGGEIAALTLIEAITRLLPGVLGNLDSAETDSFHTNLLESPIYTRPGVYRRLKVPNVLRSGNHNRIANWRRKKSIEMTLLRKPDLLGDEIFSEKDLEILLEVLNGRNS